MKKLKFYQCAHCKKVSLVLNDVDVPTVCCGENMQELEAKTADSSLEKHVPVVTRGDNNQLEVTVGSTEHPMMDAHYIQFIVLETETGFRVEYLEPGQKPSAKFFEDEKVIRVYEYCNLHGLWKVEA